MPNARALVSLLLAHVGEPYDFVVVPKENPNYHGPWDCAEFVAWGIYQVTGQYVGCRGRRRDAHTSYFAQDLPRVGTEITRSEASDMIGAIALRWPQGSHSHGHIAISRGGGLVVEAAGRRLNVTSHRTISMGDFNHFYTLNSLTYEYMCAFL